MTFEKKWPLVSIVSLGIGVGTVLIAGRSLTHTLLRWQFSRKTNLLITRLKEKLENPLAGTTVVSRLSEWEEIYPKLSRCTYMYNVFYNFVCNQQFSLVITILYSF